MVGLTAFELKLSSHSRLLTGRGSMFAFFLVGREDGAPGKGLLILFLVHLL